MFNDNLVFNMPLGGRFSFFSGVSTGNSLASLGAGQNVESCKDGISEDFFDFFDFLAVVSVILNRAMARAIALGTLHTTT